MFASIRLREYHQKAWARQGSASRIIQFIERFNKTSYWYVVISIVFLIPTAFSFSVIILFVYYERFCCFGVISIFFSPSLFSSSFPVIFIMTSYFSLLASFYLFHFTFLSNNIYVVFS